MRFRLAGWRPAALVTLAAVFAVIAPTPTRAAPATFVFPGSGWGHSVGLSQYGALEQAKDGRAWTTILGHYYQGTTIGSDDVPSAVRVQLADPVTEMKVDAGARFAFRGDGGATVASSSGGDGAWTVRKSGSGLAVYRPNGSLAAGPFSSSQRLRVAYEEWSTIVHVAQTKARYRWGQIELSLSGDKVRMVLEIALERYMRGIAEVPASWPTEALKAQATAARTYASHRAKNQGHHRSGCDCTLYGDTRDQVYRGYEKEDPAVSTNARWVSAIDATTKKVVVHSSDPILASYHSSSGGRTEASIDVWGGDLPYLRSVDDHWSQRSSNPYAHWETKLAQEEVAARLGLQRVDAIEIRSRTSGGGVKEVRVLGNSTLTMSGATLRSKLGLRSTKFSVQASQAAVWSAWKRVQSNDFATSSQSPVMVASSDKALHAMVIGSSNVPYYSRRDPASGNWSAWKRIGPAGSNGTDPGLAISGSTLHAILRGSNGNIWTARRSTAANGSWTGWSRIGPETSRGHEPAISAAPDGSIWLVKRGFSSPAIWATRRSTSGAWTGDMKVGDDGFQPAVLGTASGAVVVARDSDVSIKSSAYNGGWSSWTRVSGGSGYGPALAAAPDGKAVLVVRGTPANHLYATTLSGGAWAAWSRVSDDQTASGAEPSVVVDPAGTSHVFVRGPSDAIFTASRATTGGWAGFFNAGGANDRAGPNSVIASAAVPGRVFALIRGTNGGLYWSQRAS